ncbi:MAG TPA: hypothetical protein VGP46_13510 [Acidimicrobiales bacterium]|jgi:uncharacterized membrane protein|nr:hypothetical protein [Acidimicrobiales bacterium]
MLLAATSTSASTAALTVAVFGASAVEMVEALTLVVAAGSTRGWRSALEGAGAAVGLLAVVTVAVGLPLAHYLPIDALRATVGCLLLLMGISWLRKAILRAGGRLAKHDEDAIFARTVDSMGRRAGPTKGRDAVAFAIAFKGVMLEGSEVVLIVISLGSSSHHLALAALAATAAVLVVGGVGVAAARQLSEVPENALKTIVGVMLTSFGTFWVGEGAGVRWPGSDLWLLALIGMFGLATAIAGALLRRTDPARQPARPATR